MQTRNNTSNEPAARMLAAARRVAERVLRAGMPVWGSYTLDLTLEGLAALGEVTGEERYVESVCDTNLTSNI